MWTDHERNQPQQRCSMAACLGNAKMITHHSYRYCIANHVRTYRACCPVAGTAAMQRNDTMHSAQLLHRRCCTVGHPRTDLRSHPATSQHKQRL
jgi:hypothetical protein